jgi:hypothetical protein
MSSLFIEVSRQDSSRTAVNEKRNASFKLHQTPFVFLHVFLNLIKTSLCSVGKKLFKMFQEIGGLFTAKEILVI